MTSHIMWPVIHVYTPPLLLSCGAYLWGCVQCQSDAALGDFWWSYRWRSCPPAQPQFCMAMYKTRGCVTLEELPFDGNKATLHFPRWTGPHMLCQYTGVWLSNYHYYHSIVLKLYSTSYIHWRLGHELSPNNIWASWLTAWGIDVWPFEMQMECHSAYLSLLSLTDLIGEGNSSSATGSFFKSSHTITTCHIVLHIQRYNYISYTCTKSREPYNNTALIPLTFIRGEFWPGATPH